MDDFLEKYLKETNTVLLTKDAFEYLKKRAGVIDKIRAEIKEESRFCPLTEGLERALEIIDKYNAESEEV
jgi:hypothetical protein